MEAKTSQAVSENLPRTYAYALFSLDDPTI
jgi:hypothetical protein